jgi:CRP-like cAMP-binding protein
MPDTSELLTADDHRILRSAGAALRYSPGDILIRAGSPVNGVVVLWGGRVRLELNDRSGEEALALIGPVHIFGEHALLGEDVAPMSVVAEDEVEAQVIDVRTLRQMIAVNPDFATRLYRWLASGLSERLSRVAEFVAPPFCPE